MYKKVKLDEKSSSHEFLKHCFQKTCGSIVEKDQLPFVSGNTVIS